MMFEARELQPSAEPLKRPDLQEGTVYFILTFDDRKMLVPAVRPVVFVGTDLEGEGEDQLYFQDFESYQSGIRHGTVSRDTPATFDVCGEDDLGFVFEYGAMLNELLKCSLRRR